MYQLAGTLAIQDTKAICGPAAIILPLSQRNDGQGSPEGIQARYGQCRWDWRSGWRAGGWLWLRERNRIPKHRACADRYDGLGLKKGLRHHPVRALPAHTRVGHWQIGWLVRKNWRCSLKRALHARNVCMPPVRLDLHRRRDGQGHMSGEVRVELKDGRQRDIRPRNTIRYRRRLLAGEQVEEGCAQAVNVAARIGSAGADAPLLERRIGRG
ncbi:MAG: hypothetical protein ACUVS4_16850 [Chloroflexaceae bacterium]